MLDKDKINLFMNSTKGKSSLRTESSNKIYAIGADVEIIGYVSATLKTHGVKKFTVKATGAEEYVLSQARFRSLVNNEYKSLLGNSSLDGKYYVYSLLKVASLEYEFFNENDTKASAETLANIEDEIKVKLGPEWKITNSGSLIIDKPRFIGFRAEKIKIDSGGHMVLKGLKRAPINDEGPGGDNPRPHPSGPNCYRDCQ